MTTKTPLQASANVQAEAHPESALDAAIKAARLVSPVINGPRGARHVLVPEEFRLEAAHGPHALPPHKRLERKTNYLEVSAAQAPLISRISEA
jgi:hypothetical protein